MLPCQRKQFNSLSRRLTCSKQDNLKKKTSVSIYNGHIPFSICSLQTNEKRQHIYKYIYIYLELFYVFKKTKPPVICTQTTSLTWSEEPSCQFGMKMDETKIRPDRTPHARFDTCRLWSRKTYPREHTLVDSMFPTANLCYGFIRSSK